MVRWNPAIGTGKPPSLFTTSANKSRATQENTSRVKNTVKIKTWKRNSKIIKWFKYIRAISWKVKRLEFVIRMNWRVVIIILEVLKIINSMALESMNGERRATKESMKVDGKWECSTGKEYLRMKRQVRCWRIEVTLWRNKKRVTVNWGTEMVPGILEDGRTTSFMVRVLTLMLMEQSGLVPGKKTWDMVKQLKLAKMVLRKKLFGQIIKDNEFQKITIFPILWINLRHI